VDTRTLCLGALTSGPATGYEIKKHFEDTFGYFMEVSQSAIYPALAELLQDGLVTVSRVEQETRPDKKVYSLTPAGRARFQKDLVEAHGKHRMRSEFLVLMYFAEWLPVQRLREVLDAQLEEFTRVRAMIEHWLSQECSGLPAGMRFTAGYGAAVMGAAIDYLSEHRDELLSAPFDPIEPTEVRPEQDRLVPAAND
jgi:DNA-binding PadR family transcriptional regulator